MTDLIKRATAALLDYKQADMDGVMVETSRQAIHEVADALAARDARIAARIAELEAHCIRLGQGGAERYWEERWRDADAELTMMRSNTLAEAADQVFEPTTKSAILALVQPPKESK